MAITIADGFNITTNLPIDSRFIVADLTARDALDPLVRYEGMLSYVVADKIMYQLQGGITNGDWVLAGGGGGVVADVISDPFTGDGTTTAFTLSQPPGSKTNTFVTISGVHQTQTAYTLAGTTLTFSSPPPNLTKIEVKYGVALTGSVPPDGSVTPAKLAPLGILISSVVGGWTATGSYTDITSLSGSLLVTGRPVWVGLVSDGSGGSSSIGCSNSSAAGYVALDVKIFDGATEIHRTSIQMLAPAAGQGLLVPCSSVQQIYVPAAGTRALKVQGRLASGAGTPTAYFGFVKLVAYEL